MSGARTAITTDYGPWKPDREHEHLVQKEPADAGDTFDALKKQLPKIITTWCKSTALEEPQLRIARRISPEEAKITFEGKGVFYGSECELFFTFYLRYFDRAWSVVRWDAGGNTINQEYARVYGQIGPCYRPGNRKIALNIGICRKALSASFPSSAWEPIFEKLLLLVFSPLANERAISQTPIRRP